MCGQKPHLLTRFSNNMGAETRIEYASSTEFYLADKAAGTPWVTKLPFPTQVVKRVEICDSVSHNRIVTRYTYHHGFYDGLEREFRGFGRVDQFDTEDIASLTATDKLPADNIDGASSVPPVLTKTWFHTGIFLAGGRVSRHMEHEYYREPSADDAPLDHLLPAGLTPYEAREASRSLKGSMLRQEVYAQDGTAKAQIPYNVAESNFTIRPLQPLATNRYAVFFIHSRETINFRLRSQSSRSPDKPYAHPECRRLWQRADIGCHWYRRRMPAFEEDGRTLAT